MHVKNGFKNGFKNAIKKMRFLNAIEMLFSNAFKNAFIKCISEK
jgi:hypothetical protein